MAMMVQMIHPMDSCPDTTSNGDSTEDHYGITMTRPQSGDIVTLENLTFIPQDDFIPEPLFDLTTTGSNTDISCGDSTRTAIVLDGGHYLPGLHDIIRTQCSLNTTISNISIDAGYGHYRSDLLFPVPISKLQQQSQSMLLQVGTSIRLPVDDGNVTVRIKDIINDGTIVVLDANSPLAGSSYRCSFKLIFIDRIVNPTSIPQSVRIKASFSNDDEEEETTPIALMKLNNETIIHNNPRYQIATFALGCFWGAELAYMRTYGVVGTSVGYTNGSMRHPTYSDVCRNEGSAQEQHREAVQLIYDTTIVSYSTLFDIAIKRIHTTTASGYDLQRLFRSTNNSSNDEESQQYRHGMYYHTKEQYDILQRLLIATDTESNVNTLFERYQIEICPATTFWEAEDYHQQYLYKGGQSARKGAKEPIRCYG